MIDEIRKCDHRIDRDKGDDVNQTRSAAILFRSIWRIGQTKREFAA